MGREGNRTGARRATGVRPTCPSQAWPTGCGTGSPTRLSGRWPFPASSAQCWRSLLVSGGVDEGRAPGGRRVQPAGERLTSTWPGGKGWCGKWRRWTRSSKAGRCPRTSTCGKEMRCWPAFKAFQEPTGRRGRGAPDEQARAGCCWASAVPVLALIGLLAWVSLQPDDSPEGFVVNEDLGELDISADRARDFSLGTVRRKRCGAVGLAGARRFCWTSGLLGAHPASGKRQLCPRCTASTSDRGVEFVGVAIWDITQSAEDFVDAIRCSVSRRRRQRWNHRHRLRGQGHPGEDIHRRRRCNQEEVRGAHGRRYPADYPGRPVGRGPSTELASLTHFRAADLRRPGAILQTGSPGLTFGIPYKPLERR